MLFESLPISRGEFSIHATTDPFLCLFTIHC
jgi:hypothetical protein